MYLYQVMRHLCIWYSYVYAPCVRGNFIYGLNRHGQLSSVTFSLLYKICHITTLHTHRQLEYVPGLLWNNNSGKRSGVRISLLLDNCSNDSFECTSPKIAWPSVILPSKERSHDYMLLCLNTTLTNKWTLQLPESRSTSSEFELLNWRWS